ncbi:hypothetical protein [Streptomyces sp. NPDC005281]|uniref:hypothetical protein n=1 Tax=Streptomyces sp. NPDC005281 TaxID=3155712 RepID=UPI0033BAD8B0
MTDLHTIRAGEQTIAVRKDLRVSMRDGIELAVDAYHGVDDAPRPALIAMSAYGKELQALALTTPPQRRSAAPARCGTAASRPVTSLASSGRATSMSSATCAARATPAAR